MQPRGKALSSPASHPQILPSPVFLWRKESYLPGTHTVSPHAENPSSAYPNHMPPRFALPEQTWYYLNEAANDDKLAFNTCSASELHRELDIDTVLSRATMSIAGTYMSVRAAYHPSWLPQAESLPRVSFTILRSRSVPSIFSISTILRRQEIALAHIQQNFPTSPRSSVFTRLCPHLHTEFSYHCQALPPPGCVYLN